MTARSDTPQPGPRGTTARQRRSARQVAAERQRRQTLMTRLGIAALVVIVVAVAAFVIFQRRQTDASIPTGTQSYSYPAGQHTTGPVTYAENPPVGGQHNPVWQNCGFYASPVANENAVHSLEHGTVWITYKPDLPQDQIDTLQALAEGQTYILVSPVANLPTPVVASAWGRQLLLDAADDPRLEQFIRQFRLGPNAPEPGAPCTGGTSATT